MTGNIIARRYAKALYAVGAHKGDAEVAAYGKDLAKLAEVFAASPDAARFFRAPVFSADEKKAVIGKIMDALGVNPTIRNFAFLMADKDRLGYLPDVESVFASMLDEAQGVLRGEFVTAVPLSEARQGEIKGKLEKQTGRKLVLGFDTDADILGGLVLKIGDQVLDASLRAQLSMLKEKIKRGE